MNYAQKAAIANVLELKELIKTLKKNLAFAEDNLTRHHAPFQVNDKIKIDKRTRSKIAAPERGVYTVTSITPVTNNESPTELRWIVRLETARLSAPFFLYQYEHGWSFGANHVWTIIPKEEQ
jgi:hypothetical protein